MATFLSRLRFAGLAVVAWGSLSSVAVAAATPGVLILHTNQRPLPAGVILDESLRNGISAGFGRPVNIFSEYLDTEWASAPARYRAQEAAFLRERYRARNIRVIVASGPGALVYLAEFRDRILGGVPVVHVSVTREQLLRASPPADFVGHTADDDPLPTLQLALRLHPNAKHLLFVLGTDEGNRLWEPRIRAAAMRLSDRADAEYLLGLPTAEVLRRVGAIGSDTIIFLPGYFRDGLGELTFPRESFRRVAQAAGGPVYGANETTIGAGMVGGYVTPYEDQGKEAAGIVVALLNGSAAGTIAPQTVTRVPMVDWRQIRRWDVDEALLSPGTIVKFREQSVWERYRLQISLALAVLLTQSVLIASLLVERRSRQIAAAALNESQQQMGLAVSAARLSPWIWRVDQGKGQKVRAMTRHSHGAPDREIDFDQMIASVHPEDRVQLERAAWRAVRTAAEFDLEYRVLRPDGKVRWIAARGRAEGAHSSRLLGVAVDVTERKAADLQSAHDRTALRHMGRISMAGQLSAAIAHQLNQPLAAILGNAQAAEKLLGREQPDLAELREICRDIVSEDNRAAEIIRRLSELYQRSDMKPETIDLNTLILETFALINTELVVRHVVPATELAPMLPRIHGGRVQLQQVVLNLVLNAADAMGEVAPEQRKLLIRTESDAKEVLLSVVDNGAGIAPEHLATLFDPFWTTKSRGMGMGLSICRSIVASHNGTITAANNVEGGATFRVTLPAADA
jgi:signal transduction histidine kinase